MVDEAAKRTAEELGMELEQVELIIQTHQRHAGQVLKESLADLGETVKRLFPQQ